MLLAKVLAHAGTPWAQHYCNVIAGPAGEFIQTRQGLELLRQLQARASSQPPAAWNAELGQLTVTQPVVFCKVVARQQELLCVGITLMPGVLCLVIAHHQQ